MCVNGSRPRMAYLTWLLVGATLAALILPLLALTWVSIRSDRHSPAATRDGGPDADAS